MFYSTDLWNTKRKLNCFIDCFFAWLPMMSISRTIFKNHYISLMTVEKRIHQPQRKRFYNQIIASSSMVSIHADSIALNMEQKKFFFFGKQMITRKSSVITRKLITEGYFDDIIRSPNNPHQRNAKNWRILDNEEISNQTKTHIKNGIYTKTNWTKWLNWDNRQHPKKSSSSIRWFFIGFLYWLSHSRHLFPSIIILK